MSATPLSNHRQTRTATHPETHRHRIARGKRRCVLISICQKRSASRPLWAFVVSSSLRQNDRGQRARADDSTQVTAADRALRCNFLFVLILAFLCPHRKYAAFLRQRTCCNRLGIWRQSNRTARYRFQVSNHHVKRNTAYGCCYRCLCLIPNRVTPRSVDEIMSLRC